MKKIFASALICMMMFALGCTKGCKSSKTPPKESLKIGTNPNFPPYESKDNNGQLIGFDIDVGRELGKILHREVIFKEFDFDALLLALDKGQIDLIISGMSITESRQKEIAMIPYQGEPLTEISFLFWESAPGNITSFSDIRQLALTKNLSISVQSGHYLEEFLKNDGIPLKPLVGPPEQILDIKYKKSLAAAVDSTVGAKLASEHKGLVNIVLPLPKDKWDLGNGIGIKKSRTDLIDEVTRAVAEIKDNGTLDRLKEKWFKGGQ
jgi:arginine transport system substrate-binding protein